MLSKDLLADPAAAAVLVAALLFAVAGWVMTSCGSPGRRPLGRVAPGGRGYKPPVRRRGWARPVALPLLTLVGAAPLVALASGSAALLAPGAVLAVAAWSADRRRRDAAAQLARLNACGALLEGLAAELRSGRLPRDALARAVGGLGPDVIGWEPSERPTLVAAPVVESLLRPVGAAARVGGDVSAVLRQQALLPGAHMLGWLAACWTVSEQHGSGLADAATRIARTAQVEREQRAEVQSELSAARATARLLAVLPLVGIGLGHAMGADVVGVLLGGPLGAALVTASVALLVSGLAWVDALAARATGVRRGA
jgi:tight adherence protein B